MYGGLLIFDGWFGPIAIAEGFLSSTSARNSMIMSMRKISIE